MKKPVSNKKAVCVIGLGYVGLSLALTLADRGKMVIGVDHDIEKIAALEKSKPHFYERGLATLLRRTRRFRAKTDIPADACIDTYIIAVGTSLRGRRPHFNELEGAASTVGRRLSRGDLVILRSTVSVGATRDRVCPILERESGLSAGRDFSLAFVPERTVEGNALRELKTLPEIIGGYDETSAVKTKALCNIFAPETIIVGSLEEAEMIKLLNNAYRDYTFGFANEFALICDAFNLNTNRIIKAANHGYARGNIPVPSPGVGGYCLTKDPYFLSLSAASRGVKTSLSSCARRINRSMPAYVVRQLDKFFSAHHRVRQERRVAVLGLAFKGDPPTSDMRFSPSLDIIELLRRDSRVRLIGHDAVVPLKEFAQYNIEAAPDINKAFTGAHAVVIMNNHVAYRTLDLAMLSKRMAKPALLVDTWSLYEPGSIAVIPRLHYSNLGYDTI